MPYPNYHAARVRDPDDFKDGSIRTIKLGRQGSNLGVLLLAGRLKDDIARNEGKRLNIFERQAYRFDRKKFTPAEAKKWLKDHDIKYKSFESATGEESQEIEEPIIMADLTNESFNEDFSFEEPQFEVDEKAKLGIFKGYMASSGKVNKNGYLLADDSLDESISELKGRNRPIRVFYNHRTQDLPIGKIEPSTVQKKGNRWYVEGQIALNTDLGRDVFTLMDQKILSDMSVGITINEWEFQEKKGKDDPICLIHKANLREVSIVVDPADPQATVTVTNGATPFHDLPIAPDDTVWDSEAANARVRQFTNSEDSPSSSYRNAFFWYDPKNADNFGAYKLPYADVINNKLMAVPKAIYAAAAAMAGARGGVDLPDADRSKVINHINKYYKKMDKESPLGNSQMASSEQLTISDALQFKTRREFEDCLRESGGFSKEAAVYLASKMVIDDELGEPVSTEIADNTVSLLHEFKAMISKI